MQRFFLKTFFCIIFCSLFVHAYSLPDAENLLRNMEKMLLPDGVEYLADFKVVRGKDEFSYRIKMWAKERLFVAKVLYPATDKGIVFLYRNGLSWVYYPSIQKVVKTSEKQKVLGGDFSISDFSFIDVLKDYDYEISEAKRNEINNPYIDKAKSAYIITCQLKKGAKASYPMVKIYFGENLLPIAQEHFTVSGHLLSTLLYEFDGKEQGDGRKRPAKIYMRSTLDTNNYTVIKYLETIYKNVPSVYFTPGEMKSLSER